jgi:hypothetical protein
MRIRCGTGSAAPHRTETGGVFGSISSQAERDHMPIRGFGIWAGTLPDAEALTDTQHAAGEHRVLLNATRLACRRVQLTANQTMRRSLPVPTPGSPAAVASQTGWCNGCCATAGSARWFMTVHPTCSTSGDHTASSPTASTEPSCCVNRVIAPIRAARTPRPCTPTTASIGSTVAAPTWIICCCYVNATTRPTTPGSSKS